MTDLLDQHGGASVNAANTSAGSGNRHLWDDLSEMQQRGIARAWRHDLNNPVELAQLRTVFNGQSPENRWHVACASERCDGSYGAEVAGIAGNADPATSAAFTPSQG